MVFQPFRCHPHPDADGVQETDNDGKANDGSKGKKRKRVIATDLAFHLRVGLYVTKRGYSIWQTLIKPRGV